MYMLFPHVRLYEGVCLYLSKSPVLHRVAHIGWVWEHVWSVNVVDRFDFRKSSQVLVVQKFITQLCLKKEHYYGFKTLSTHIVICRLVCCCPLVVMLNKWKLIKKRIIFKCTYIDNSARGARCTGGRSRGDALRGGSRHLETKTRWEKQRH